MLQAIAIFSFDLNSVIATLFLSKNEKKRKSNFVRKNKVKKSLDKMLLFLLASGILAKLFAIATCEPSEVKVLLSDYEPYVIPGEFPKGLDVAILENFAQKCKLTTKYIRTNVSMAEVSRNGSDIWAIINQYYSNVDIIAGGLGWNRFSSERFIESRSYHYDRLMWCVMKRRAIQPGYEIFYLCNDGTVIVVCAIAVVAVLCLAYYFQQFERQPKWNWNRILIHFVGYCCSITCSYAPKTTANRILLTIVLFFAIVFDAQFIGRFLNKMQLQKEDYSIDEIFDGSYRLIGDPLAYQYLKKPNQVCLHFFAGIFDFDTFDIDKFCNLFSRLIIQRNLKTFKCVLIFSPVSINSRCVRM